MFLVVALTRLMILEIRFLSEGRLVVKRLDPAVSPDFRLIEVKPAHALVLEYLSALDELTVG